MSFELVLSFSIMEKNVSNLFKKNEGDFDISEAPLPESKLLLLSCDRHSFVPRVIF